MSFEDSLPVIRGAQLRTWGHREAMSPESVLTIVVMDSGLALRAPRNDDGGCGDAAHAHTRNSRA
ncbi:hypothetical protein BraRD5C2_57750 [Bradyrhizobium sp. RD5-C2]|nr:hypothetical protein BraRD5C2_57750 [Bradyrhizobium sp. RD5-C2]